MHSLPTPRPGGSRSRRARSAAAGAWWLAIPLLLSGCLVAEHRSFETPLDTVRTFQSAFARGEETDEYQCLSSALRARVGGMQGFGLFREKLALGSVETFVLARNDLQDNLAGRLESAAGTELWFELFGQDVGIALVPEWLLEFRIEADYTPLRAPVAPRWSVLPAEEQTWLALSLSLACSEADRLFAGDVRQIELHREWKIDALLEPPLPELDPASVIEPEPPAEEPPTEVEEWTLRAGRRGLLDCEVFLALPLTPVQVETIRQGGPPIRGNVHRWRIRPSQAKS
jgi:hypothetical protein